DRQHPQIADPIALRNSAVETQQHRPRHRERDEDDVEHDQEQVGTHAGCQARDPEFQPYFSAITGVGIQRDAWTHVIPPELTQEQRGEVHLTQKGRSEVTANAASELSPRYVDVLSHPVLRTYLH